MKESDRDPAKTEVRVLRPLRVSTYPTIPTTLMGGVSMIVTGSTFSFLFRRDPVLAYSLTTWVIPAFTPAKAVR